MLLATHLRAGYSTISSFAECTLNSKMSCHAARYFCSMGREGRENASYSDLTLLWFRV